MTSEIVIMNREVIALAADSAITMIGESDHKVKTSANKLFALSKYHPVGIMVYGDAVFMGVPWETIIKIYRNKLGKTNFNTLEEYATDFITFLDSENPLFHDSVQETYVHDFVYAYFKLIEVVIEEEVESKIDEKGEITEEEVKKLVSGRIREHYEIWEKPDNIPSVPKSFNKDITEKYKKIFDKVVEEVFEKLPLSKRELTQLKKIAGNLFSKYPEEFPGDVFSVSGVVIAGFGEEDTFPTLVSFHIDGMANNRLKYKADDPQKIDVETLNASINAFAQRKMVYMFMEGIDPELEDLIDGYLSELFDKYPEIIFEKIEKSIKEKELLREQLKEASDKLFREYQERIRSLRNENFVDPIISVVSLLPKDELAEMAEALVSLTSFKQKVTMESETVGGPIDVAVISKGDGFIWIKRKHYFSAELNPQFLAKYYK